MSNIEQTLSIIKPDAVERNLQDKIIYFKDLARFSTSCIVFTISSGL